MIVEGPQSAAAKFLADRFVSYCANGEPISNREYADLFLKAVREKQLSVHDWLRLVGGADTEDDGRQTPVTVEAERLTYYRKTLGHLVELHGPQTAAMQREAARRHVEAAHLISESRVNGRVAAVPVLNFWNKRGLQIAYKIVGIDAQACLDYAFALILSEFAEDLCLCQRKGCGKFWFYKPEDKLREYCRSEHRDEQLNADSKYRKQASRAGVTADEWREITEIQPSMTAQNWNALKAKRPSINAQKWIAEQKRIAK